jgi:uncharacterized protein (DUF3084 family)
MSITKFADWEKAKYSVKEDNEKKTEEKKDSSSAHLIAELEDLTEKRKKALREKDSYEAQILELEIKLKKLDIEKADLQKKQKDLSEAREIAKKTKLEGRTHDQE